MFASKILAAFYAMVGIIPVLGVFDAACAQEKAPAFDVTSALPRGSAEFLAELADTNRTQQPDLVQTTIVYRPSAGERAYNHHPHVAAFGDRLYLIARANKSATLKIT